MDDPLPLLTLQDTEKIGQSLKETGVACICLPAEFASDHSNAFTEFHKSLQHVRSCPDEVDLIPPNADSGHATGYHSAGGSNSMSRYNEYREGYVFSDGDTVEIQGRRSFSTTMAALEQSLYAIANVGLNALEMSLDLPTGWFVREYGPFHISGQWHIKRYHVAAATPSPLGEGVDDNPRVLLPIHTDPSLISVVVHDSLGQNTGAMGLEYLFRSGKTNPCWREVPWHGHEVAVIFTGSILAHITGNTWKGTKHRVVERLGNPRRCAATLFVRPRSGAILSKPPSRELEKVILKKTMSCNAWLAKVSKNYSKRGHDSGKGMSTNTGRKTRPSQSS